MKCHSGKGRLNFILALINVHYIYVQVGREIFFVLSHESTHLTKSPIVRRRDHSPKGLA